MERRKFKISHFAKSISLRVDKLVIMDGRAVGATGSESNCKREGEALFKRKNSGPAWRRMTCLSIGAMFLSLAGCKTPENRAFGLSPELQAEDVVKAQDNKQRIMNALRIDAAGGTTDTVSWYDVTTAGFNFVDDQCSSYFNVLFKLRRRDEALKSGLNAFGATSNAILSATGSSSLTMTIVAQAFNLGYQLTEIHSNTFLYSLPPSETSVFVKKLQKAYRDGVASKASSLSSAAAGYHEIQEYLSLCLPQTIEAQLIGHVSDASVAPSKLTQSGEVYLNVGTARTAKEKATDISDSGWIDSLQEPPGVTGFITPFEKQLSPTVIGKVQEALCVEKDMKWGPATRAAVVEFFNGAGDPRPRIAQSGITSDDMKTLSRAMAIEPVCGAADAHKSAFGLGTLLD